MADLTFNAMNYLKASFKPLNLLRSWKMNLRTCGTFLVLSACLISALPATAASANIDQWVANAAKHEVGASMESFRQLEILVKQSTKDKALKAELEQGLIKLLAPDTTYAAKHFACKQLAVIGSEACLPAVGELLKNKETVSLACLALSTNPSAKINGLLRPALADSSGLAKVQIISILANRRVGEVVPDLIQLSKDADTAIAEAALAALGRIATPEACGELARLRKDLKSPHTPVVLEASLQSAGELVAADEKKMATVIYRRLADPDMPRRIRCAALAGLFRCDRDGGEQRIFVVLRTQDPVLKPVAIAAIPSLKSPRASAKLARELPRCEPHEQVLLIQALAARGDAAAKTAINAQVNAKDVAVRQAAIRAVSDIGDATSVPLLTKALVSAAQPQEAQFVEQALSSLRGGAEINRAIIAELPTVPGETCARLISVLSRRGSTEAVPALLSETAEPATAKAAFQALGKLASAKELDTLVEQLVNLKVPAARNEAESAVAQVMLKVPEADRRSAAVCKALAQTTDLDTRCSLLGLLPTGGDATAFAALKPVLTDSDSRVRDTAIRALAQWPNATAWNALLDVYQKPGSEAHRVIAIRALVRLVGDENAKPGPTMVEHYRQLLADAKNDEDRKLILGALGGAPSAEALQLALPLLANASVRAEAELAVKKIAAAINDKNPQAAQEALQKLK